MRARQELDNVLDECLERVLFRGETLEQCLEYYPGQAVALEPLLRTALVAKQASAIQPRPEFRTKARYQFRRALQEAASRRNRPFLVWLPRWATVVTAVLVLLLAGSGTVAAANNSMPDEALYPVKLATEQVRLVFTPSALGKAELYARLSDRRVLEIERMADKNKPEQIEKAAQRLDVYLTRIATLSSPQEVSGVTAMAPPVEVEEAPSVREALVPSKVPAPAEKAKGEKEKHEKPDRRAQLKTIVASHAISQTDRLRAVLEKVPESAKPALQRTITRLEAGYDKVLEALD